MDLPAHSAHLRAASARVACAADAIVWQLTRRCVSTGIRSIALRMPAVFPQPTPCALAFRSGVNVTTFPECRVVCL